LASPRIKIRAEQAEADRRGGPAIFSEKILEAGA
jgi:hypothetical protein